MIPVIIFYPTLGYYPSPRGPVIISLIGVYKPILKPANTNYLCNPADNPPKSASGPSSAPIALTVYINPLYLGSSPGTTFWIYNLTFAVSKGIVAVSATIAEKEAIPTFLKKNATSLSPSLFFVFINLINKYTIRHIQNLTNLKWIKIF